MTSLHNLIILGSFKKVLWVVMCLGAAAGMIVNLINISLYYFDRKVSVKITVTQKRNLPFPGQY